MIECGRFLEPDESSRVGTAQVWICSADQILFARGHVKRHPGRIQAWLPRHGQEKSLGACPACMPQVDQRFQCQAALDEISETETGMSLTPHAVGAYVYGFDVWV